MTDIDKQRIAALREADEVLQALLRSGDEELFAAATDVNGRVDEPRLVSAMIRARERLADQIMTEWDGKVPGGKA